jgi:hypothetical protein
MILILGRAITPAGVTIAERGQHGPKPSGTPPWSRIPSLARKGFPAQTSDRHEGRFLAAMGHEKTRSSRILPQRYNMQIKSYALEKVTVYIITPLVDDAKRGT